MRILILLIFFIVFPSAGALGHNADRVTITIERVARSINTKPKNRSTGLVELKFADHYADISKFFQYRMSKSVRVDKPVTPKSVSNK